MIKVLFRLFMH